MAEIDWELTKGLALNMINLLAASMEDREGFDAAHAARQVLVTPAWAMAFQLATMMEEAPEKIAGEAMEIVNEAINRAGLPYQLTPLPRS